MNSAVHLFAISNVPRHVSYYESNFAPLERCVRLSGYPHCVLEKIISAVYRRAQEENTPAEIVHHCLDNTMQGIILPERSCGVFGFDVYDPEEINYLSDTKDGAIASINENLGRAREIFTKARVFHDEQEKIYIAHMDFNAADRLTKETIHMLFDGKSLDCPGTEVHRFFGAATVDGNVNYIPEVTRDIPKRYLIKGRPGTGKSTFLKKIAQTAVERGFRTEIYHCSLDPDSLDLVAVRELGFCLFDSTAPHEYFPERPEDEIIDIYKTCVTPGTDEKYQAELSESQAAYKEMIASGVAFLKKAKEESDRFDATLPEIDIDVLKQVTQNVLKKLF